MSVYYKFKSSLNFDKITFDGLHISVGDLKKAIMQQKKIGKSLDFDLQITNAQTKEVYESEDTLIAKNTTVIVSRVPIDGSKKHWDKGEQQSSASANNTGFITLDKILRSSDLSKSNASEEDKIKAMMNQSTLDYDSSKYVKSRGMVGPLPPNYTCYRCGQPGHYIKLCPTNNMDIKRSTGIPRSFMIPASAEDKGALLTSSGEYAVPIIDHEAYKEVKKDKPIYMETEENSKDKCKPLIPEHLQCTLCHELLQDAVITPCCTESFCDTCIRSKLLESEDHQCPVCLETEVLPDILIPIRYLRKLVIKFMEDLKKEEEEQKMERETLQDDDRKDDKMEASGDQGDVETLSEKKDDDKGIKDSEKIDENNELKEEKIDNDIKPSAIIVTNEDALLTPPRIQNSSDDLTEIKSQIREEYLYKEIKGSEEYMEKEFNEISLKEETDSELTKQDVLKEVNDETQETIVKREELIDTNEESKLSTIDNIDSGDDTRDIKSENETSTHVTKDEQEHEEANPNRTPLLDDVSSDPLEKTVGKEEIQPVNPIPTINSIETIDPSSIMDANVVGSRPIPPMIRGMMRYPNMGMSNMSSYGYGPMGPMGMHTVDPYGFMNHCVTLPHTAHSQMQYAPPMNNISGGSKGLVNDMAYRYNKVSDDDYQNTLDRFVKQLESKSRKRSRSRSRRSSSHSRYRRSRSPSYSRRKYDDRDKRDKGRSRYRPRSRERRGRSRDRSGKGDRSGRKRSRERRIHSSERSVSRERKRTSRRRSREKKKKSV